MHAGGTPAAGAAAIGSAATRSAAVSRVVAIAITHITWSGSRLRYDPRDSPSLRRVKASRRPGSSRIEARWDAAARRRGRCARIGGGG